jgi:hypothetical protein
MTTVPKTVSGAAILLLGILVTLSPSDAFAAKHKPSITAKRITLLQEALVLVKAGETQFTGDRLRATLDIQQALTVLGSTSEQPPAAKPAPTPANLAVLRESLEKGQKKLGEALDTMSQKDIAVANPVISAINHVDKAAFLVLIQERAAAAQSTSSQTPAQSSATATIPTPGAGALPPASPTNALPVPTGGEEVKPVQSQQEQNGQTTTPSPATTAPTNTP